MHKLYLALFIFSVCLLSIFVGQNSYAISQNLVISQVQIGNVSNSRLIELYNNSDESIDITGWRLWQSSASDKTKNELIYFNTINTSVHLILNARSYLFIGSAQLGLEADFSLDKGIGLASGGHIYITDKDNKSIDRLSWGTKQGIDDNDEPKVISDDNNNYVLERKKIDDDIYQDTNNDANDFFDSDLREEYLYGSVYEVIDVCKNIDEIQVLVPEGFFLDINGDCVADIIDICPNIDGIQDELPIDKIIDSDGNCIFPPIDICLNLDGLQVILPDKYKLINNKCMLDLLPINITEILPNAIGSDNGGEFIEIFNPNNETIDLSFYLLLIGKNNPKFYRFPNNSFIEPNNYLTFYNNEIYFTLVNTSSMVSILTADEQLVDETLIYNNPKEGESWALIDDIWQFTNQPTPGSFNLSSIVNIENKIIASTSILKPCKDGQYRSEETNRCRNIVTDVANLVPCAEGQERNPATNRCRTITAILGDSDLKPCGPGQERNPETNRCRNVIGDIPKADYAPEQTISLSNNSFTWWIFGGVGAVAIGYGVWEWRRELIKLVLFLRHKK